MSVVATGIEQTTEQAEIAARPVSLGNARGPAFPGAAPAAPRAAAPGFVSPAAPPPAPIAAAPVATAPVVAQPEPVAPPPVEEPLDLTLDLSEDSVAAPEQPVVPRFARGGPDDDYVATPAPPAPARGAAPAPGAAGGGSTLFERMANLSRATRAPEPEPEEDEGRALNIPRFLGRQNNQ